MIKITGIKEITITELTVGTYDEVLKTLNNLKTDSKITSNDYYDKEDGRTLYFSIIKPDGETLIFNENASLITITDDNGEVFNYITSKEFKYIFTKL